MAIRGNLMGQYMERRDKEARQAVAMEILDIVGVEGTFWSTGKLYIGLEPVLLGRLFKLNRGGLAVPLSLGNLLFGQKHTVILECGFRVASGEDYGAP